MGYNGASGDPYNTISLSDVLPDQQAGFGTVAVDFTGLQNGSPDGLALISDAGIVVQFLSYGGVFSATNGACSGRASQDIGVTESSATPVGSSLRLSGGGSGYAQFAWQPPAPQSAGLPNANQVFQ